MIPNCTLIYNCGLSRRAWRGLERAGCRTVGDAREARDGDLLNQKNFGERTLMEVREKLGRRIVTETLLRIAVKITFGPDGSRQTSVWNAEASDAEADYIVVAHLPDKQPVEVVGEVV